MPARGRLAAALGGHLPASGMRVGLLGGSFNPAHQGHARISEWALKRLRLDEVWWLVSPQNPLKPAAEMASFQARLDTARARATHPRIFVSSLEEVFRTRYTVDTVRWLQASFPGVVFVWLMGADNLVQIERWRGWPQIFSSMSVAVFDRPSYSLKSMAGKAAIRFGRYRLPESAAWKVGSLRPPVWVFMHQPLNPESASRIRARCDGRAKGSKRT